jgi:hypothetical protein
VGITDNGVETGVTTSPYVITGIAGNHVIDVRMSNSYTHTLTLTANGNGTITIHADGFQDVTCRANTCPVAYPAGTTVTLTPVADEENTFGCWSACEAPSDLSCNITMNADKSITGSFLDYCQMFLLQRFGIQPIY